MVEEGTTIRAPRLVTLDDIKPFIHESVYQKLTAVEHFLDIELAAAYIARDSGGLTLPETIDLRPDWVVIPMAWIITYLELPSQRMETEIINTVTKNYTNAIQMINDKANQAVSGTETGEFSHAGLTTRRFKWR